MSLLKIKMTFPSLEAALKKHQAGANLLMLATAQTNRGMLFDREGKYSGHQKWEPLKMRKGQILSRKGVLRKSIAPHGSKGEPGPQGIAHSNGFLKGEIGTKVAYARIQNDGAVIRANAGKVLSFVNEITGKRVYCKKVTIPARNFTAWTSQDQQEMDATMAAFILEKAFAP